VTYDDITWFIPRPSYGDWTLPRPALDTLTDCEALVAELSVSEIAAWMCDLITTRHALEIALHAAMDELHASLDCEEPLRERVRGLLRINLELRAEVQRLAGAK